MHKHKKSSNKFLLVGLAIVVLLSIVLIRLQEEPVDDVLVEVVPVQTTPKADQKPTPAPALTTLYVNTRLNYTVIIPGDARLTVTEDGKEKTVTTLPADAREVRIYSGGTYLSISDKTYTLPAGTRTQGTTEIGGRSYRSTKTPGQTTIYVREGLTVYYGPTVPSMMLASLRIK